MNDRIKGTLRCLVKMKPQSSSAKKWLLKTNFKESIYLSIYSMNFLTVCLREAFTKQNKNTLTKSNLGEKWFILTHNSILQLIIAGKSRLELEAAGHPESQAERTCTHAYCSACFVYPYSSGPNPRPGGPGLLTSVNIMKTSLTQM